MKIFLIFPVILTAIFSKATIKPKVNPFETITVSPLYAGRDSTFIIDTKAALLNIKFYISNDLYQNKLIYSNMFTRSGKHVITYNNEFTRMSNELYISYESVRKWITSDPISLNVSADTYRHLEDNNSFTSVDKVSVLTYSTFTWSQHQVNYSFTNFDGLYIPDYYHKIKLSDFKINIAAEDRSLFKCNPNIVISNVNGVFNDVATTSSVNFPLKLVSADTGFTFELQDILYVHKETLMLSKTAKEGYVQTKHIFFPRNDMQNQDKYKAYFALGEFGIDRDFVRHNFEIRALKNIVGDCRNSEYCIQRL